MRFAFYMPWIWPKGPHSEGKQFLLDRQQQTIFSFWEHKVSSSNLVFIVKEWTHKGKSSRSGKYTFDDSLMMNKKGSPQVQLFNLVRNYSYEFETRDYRQLSCYCYSVRKAGEVKHACTSDLLLHFFWCHWLKESDSIFYLLDPYTQGIHIQNRT